MVGYRTEKINDRDEVSDEQLRSFQNLMTKLLQWCHERAQYQSVKFDLPDAEIRCLMLFDGEQSLTPKKIAGSMNIVKSRVSKVLDGLAKKGLITRVKHQKDSRLLLLNLTRHGHGKVEEIKKFNDYIHKKVLMTMRPEQRKTLLAALNTLQASLKSSREIMFHETQSIE